MAIKEKTQGEKTQNSRTKLKFSAFQSGEIDVNIGMKCFFTSTFKGKEYGKYQKGTINLNKKLLEAKTQAKPFKNSRKNSKLKNSASH